jgi:hypothetical protein
MLWWALSFFFFWLSAREIYHRFVPRRGFDRPSRAISLPYVLITASIAALLAYTPLRTWQTERFLAEKARVLSENEHAFVHCNTFFDSATDPNSLAAGHADPRTGRIVLQLPWCDRLMDYLAKPEKAGHEGIHSVHLFTHEAMHIRGERNEAVTDCQAVQRYYRAAKLLGVSEQFATEHSAINYKVLYRQRGDVGGYAGQYYSDQCAPGRALDERLSDSVWKY